MSTDNMADDEIGGVLQNMGIEFRRLNDSTFIIESNDFQAFLINGQGNMKLVAGFTQKASQAKVNEWNRTKKRTTAYFYPYGHGHACIAADLISYGGGHIEEFIKYFQRTVTAFAAYLLS